MDNKTIAELLNVLQKQKIKKASLIKMPNNQEKDSELPTLDQINPLHDNFNLFKMIDIITILGYIYSIYTTILLIFDGERVITQNIYYYLGVLGISLVSILF